MNCLGIDYGLKRVGLAISIRDIITPHSVIQNDKNLVSNIINIIKDEKIEKIFIGISEGDVAKKTKIFAENLSNMIQLPIETVEESVSTIEADGIYLQNRKKKKDYKKNIDSIAAAVILRRALG